MAVKYDIIIIGAGPGGYTAALKAASLGMHVAVIEKDKLGGVCVNRGCIPTKALLHASHIFNMLQRSDEFGVSVDSMSFDYGRMMNYKKRSVKVYRDEIKEEFEAAGIDYISGTATLRREKTVEVHSDSGREYYEAKHIILATGAKPASLPIPGVDLSGVINSDKLLTQTSWNYDRITIIGGGVIGVECATIFQQLCSKVTIVERDRHLLGPMDPEVSSALEDALNEKGIAVHCDATVKEIQNNDGLVTVIHKEGKTINIKSGCVVMAVGRIPNMDNLIGDDVDIPLDDRGRICVNPEFETGIKGVYAIGDLVAKTQLAHVAAAQGTYVVESIAGKHHTIQLEVVPSGMFVTLPIVPSCIYTNPEIASVGITEENAKDAGLKVVCGHYLMKGNGKSIIVGAEHGFIRLIFEAYSRSLIGAQMVCPRATDMIGEMATAIANSLSASQLMKAMRAHPTYSEGITYAIQDAMDKFEN